MTPTLRPALLVLLAALAAASAAGPAAAQQATVHTVTQRDGRFVPSALTVKRGDAVVFRNDDDRPHHVVSHTPFFKFDLDLQGPGGEGTVVFDKPGTVVVGCDLHSAMETLVTVE
ncbi:MAG TPA: cupredoxin domain-containing protein [Azospirillaceae bacterium]|nr:cupredoxin domain-containing protein [Azospirillaceae bacterium]